MRYLSCKHALVILASLSTLLLGAYPSIATSLGDVPIGLPETSLKDFSDIENFLGTGDYGFSSPDRGVPGRRAGGDR